MVQFLTLLIGFILGCFMGMIIMCCLTVSGRCSDEEEKEKRNH